MVIRKGEDTVTGFLPGLSRRDVKLAIHTYIVPTLRMSGAISLLPLYAFMAWTGTSLNSHIVTSALRYKPEGRGFDS